VSEHVSVEVGPGGGPVAVKRAEGDDGRQRLRREAEVLQAVQGPGVVDFVALDDDDTTTSLSTAWLGGGTFATASFAPKKLASVTASLALTVASLHDRGVVHRRLTGDHVLLDSAGRVVLTGFAEATDASTSSDTAPSARAMADDAHDIGDPCRKLPAEPPPRPQAAPPQRAGGRRTAARDCEPRHRCRSDEAPVSQGARRLADRGGGRTATGATRGSIPSVGPELARTRRAVPACACARCRKTAIGRHERVRIRAVAVAACVGVVVTIARSSPPSQAEVGTDRLAGRADRGDHHCGTDHCGSGRAGVAHDLGLDRGGDDRAGRDPRRRSAVTSVSRTT
jgi:serine/threonine protein kinase